MLKLYARKGAGSDAVEALLAVCGVAHEVEYLRKGADGLNPPGLRRISPRAEIPALVLDDGSVMTESAAILLWLADAYPAAGMAPVPDSPLRPRFLRWLLFLAAAPYANVLLYYYPHRYTTGPGAEAAIKAQAILALNRDFAILSGAIGQGPFILGAAMSVADIYAAMLISWADDLPGLFTRHPNLRVLCERVMAQRAIGQVWSHVAF